MKNAELKWGVTNGNEVTVLNPKIKKVKIINFTKEMKSFLPFPQKLFIPIIYLLNNRLGIYK